MHAVTATIVFTDIEGSTSLLARVGVSDYAGAVARQRELLERAFGSPPLGTEGDGCLFVIETASAAVEGALSAQLALHADPGSTGGEPVKVRIGLHTGEVHATATGGVVGLAVHHAARIAAAAHGGQVILSPTTAAVLGGALPPGATLGALGLHRLKDVAEPIALYQLEHPGLPRSFPPPNSLGRPGGRLPVPPSPLIGRSREMAEIEAALASGARLVTLVGPGGAGKTRTATEVALRAERQFDGGVWFARLSDDHDEATAWQTLATLLGVPQGTADLASAVTGRLAERPALLVLDNLEQLTGAGALVDALVSAGPTRVIATSRTPLHLSHEIQVAIDELNEIIELFDSRARAAVPGWMLDDHREHVEEICRRLDRLPLAVELVVPRLRTETAAHVAAALREAVSAPLEVTVDAAGTRDPRHQTLRAVTEWSIDRLDDHARRTFSLLAVFAGGFTRDAVAAVAGAEGATADLDRLVDASLVAARPGPDGRMRFRLLDTIRAVAAEQLARRADRGSVVTRHREWLYGIARARPDFTDLDEHRTWLELLDDEQANIAGALDAAGDDSGAQAALVVALAPWWFERGYLTDGRRRVAAAIDAIGDDETAADLHRWLGRLHLAASDAEDATYAFLAALGGAQALSDRTGTLRDLLHALAESRNQSVFAAEIRKVAAHAALTAALERADEAGDAVAAAMSYTFAIQTAAGDGPPALKARVKTLKRTLRRFDVADHLAAALGEVRPPVTTVPFTVRGRRTVAAIAAASAACGHRTMLAQVLTTADPAGASGVIDQLLSLGRGAESLGDLAGDQALASVAQGALARGDLRRARDLAELAVERSAGDPEALGRALAARGAVNLATGATGQAAGDSLRSGQLLQGWRATKAVSSRAGLALRNVIRNSRHDARRWRLHLTSTSVLIGTAVALVTVAPKLAVVAGALAGIRTLGMLRLMAQVVMGPRQGESGGGFLVLALVAAGVHAPWLICVLALTAYAATAPAPALFAIAATPLVGAFLPSEGGAAFLPFAVVPWFAIATRSRGHSWPGWLTGRTAMMTTVRSVGVAIGFGAFAVLPGPFYRRYFLVAVGTAAVALGVVGVEVFRRRRDLRVGAACLLLAGGAGAVGAVMASVAVSLAAAGGVALAFLAIAARPTGFWPSIPRLDIDAPTPSESHPPTEPVA